jgi:hypothetical protein
MTTYPELPLCCFLVSASKNNECSVAEKYKLKPKNKGC